MVFISNTIISNVHKKSNFENPNVLLITVDYWLGCLLAGLGHSVILTPTLDQLLSNGVGFTNANFVINV